MLTDKLIYWIRERESIRAQKEAGYAKPWTRDPILLTYKFCNVERESDRVTKWIHKHWLMPYADCPNVAFAMCVARHFNWPDTLEVIGFPEVWHPETVRSILKNRRDKEGKKIYTGAYTVSTCGRSMEKIDYSLDVVLTPMYYKLKNPNFDTTLEEYWKELQNHEGFSSFMAGQVIADLKYIKPLSDAPDWNTFAPLGPGSIRGLNRFFNRPLAYNVKQVQGTEELISIQEIIKQQTGLDLALHNVQNCMCEFDKFIRLQEGGKVRSKYNGVI